MPLSEFLRLAIEKLESSRNKPCSIDLSSPRAENDLVQDGGIGNSTTRSVGNFGEVEDVNLGLNQNDEIIPWLSYSVDDDDDDGMQDYCSELLPEISDVTGDGILPGKSSDQAISNLDIDFKVSKGRTSCSWLTQQGQTSDPTASNIIRTNNDSNNHNNSSCNNQDSILLNFSNFARPANGKMEVQEKGSSCRCKSKAVVVERLSISHKDIDFPVPSAPTLFKSGKLAVRESKESFLAERSENLLPKKNEKAIFQSSGVIDIDRIVEPVVACSSVGSGNSADRVSCEQTHHSKRKFIDIEEFECHSEDVETESVGVKKRTLARGGSGLKRSRAAEVHNLSERRRRDRINEKMRALQELIPNCNKADKASMLDEAIEYLKNLQLQVQMMSMGAGLCMPQMMFHPHLSAMRFSGSPQYPIFPMQRPHFPSSSSGPANFPRIPLRISSYNEMPSTPPKLNSEDLTGNKNLNFKNTAEGGNSMNRTSNQTSAVHEKKQASDVGRRGALTSTSATSKEAGCD